VEYLKQMGVNLNVRTIRRKQAMTLSEYRLIHFLRMGESKMDRHCEAIACYLKEHPKEAKFWKQNYAEWCWLDYQAQA